MQLRLKTIYSIRYIYIQYNLIPNSVNRQFFVTKAKVYNNQQLSLSAFHACPHSEKSNTNEQSSENYIYSPINRAAKFPVNREK